MDVHLSYPVQSAQQLCSWLQAQMPHHRFKVVGKSVTMIKSSWVGLSIMPMGNTVRLSGDMPPDAGARILLNALFPVGILPGIIAYLIFWLSVRSSWKAMEKRVAACLRGEAVPAEAIGADGKLQEGPGLLTRLAPAWMLGVSLALFVPAGCASCAAYDNIGNRYYNTRFDLTRSETRLEISQANLERAKKNGPIPAGCPEAELQGWDNNLRKTCHGCKASDYFANPNVQKIRRDNETLYCPTVAQLQGTVTENQEAYDKVDSRATGALAVGFVWTLAALTLWGALAIGLLVWWTKNKALRAADKAGKPSPAPQPSPTPSPHLAPPLQPVVVYAQAGGPFPAKS